MFSTLLPKQVAFNRILLLIIALNFLSRLVLVLKPLPYLDGKTVPDDAYLSLHIARSIGNGQGPWYDDVYTNGFQPLYVFLMAPVYALSDDQVEAPVTIALLLLSIFDTATLAVLLLWIRKMTSTSIAVLTSILWIFNDYIIQTSLNGLETIMATFFIVTAAYYFYLIYYQKKERKNIHFIGLGLFAGLACLTRVDSLIFAFILGIFILIREFPDKKLWIIRSGFYGISALAVFSIWIAYSLYYTGLWYPESGKAVRLISLTHINFKTNLAFFQKMFWQAGVVEWKGNGFLIVLIAIMLLVAWRKKALKFSSFNPILPIGIFCISILLAYTCYVFTDWYFYRYFFPLTIAFLLIFALLANTIFPFLTASKKIYYGGLILAIWFIPLFIKGTFVDYYIGPPSKTLGYRNIAVWANENFPEGTIIGASQTGALGYFCTKLKVVNLDGVVNGECYKYLVEDRNMDYIRLRKIEYILGWTINMDFIRLRTKNFQESELELIKNIDDFYSWNNQWGVYRVMPPASHQ
ncbi:MAG TPA: hypothetical protein VGK59_03365 [Ohtaekwangia sp.]